MVRAQWLKSEAKSWGRNTARHRHSKFLESHVRQQLEATCTCTCDMQQTRAPSQDKTKTAGCLSPQCQSPSNLQ